MSEPVITESLISRQPILDTQQNLVGYELTLISPVAEAYRSRVSTLLCAAYAEPGIRSALWRSSAFLRVYL